MKQHTITAWAGALALATGLTLIPSQQARAAWDYKGISATECQPFLPTTYADVPFKNNAIINTTGVNQRVICPVNKDAQTTWTAGMVTFYAYIRAGSTAGKVSCTLYGGGSAYGTQVSYGATSDLVAAGSNSNFTIPNIADPSGGVTLEGWNVLCTLNPGMALSGFWWGEDFDTDGDN